MMRSSAETAAGTAGVGLLGFLIFAIAPAIWDEYIPMMETSIWPVVSPIVIDQDSIRDVEGGIEFSASAEKLRDCSWRRTEWRQGPRDGVNIPLESKPHRDPPKINTVGRLVWGRIFLPIARDELPNTHANAYHNCYLDDGRQTRSRFFK